MDAIIARLKDEPVLVLAAIQSALALGVSFGLHLQPEQIGAVLAFSSAILGLIARKQVTPA